MRPPHRLFFAAQPDPAAAAQASARVGALQDRLRLGGRPTAADHQHVTLHWLADHEDFPVELVAVACAAGAAVEHAPFDVVFDHIGSIGDAAHPGPVVLTGGAGLRALRELQRALGRELDAAGLGRYVRRSFKPHLTLLYPRPPAHVPAQPVAPLRWTLRELVLIDSHAGGGNTEYRILGRWPLCSRQLDLLDG